MTLDIDRIRIHFDTESLWILNIAIGIIMFGVALGITTEDFRRLIRNPKILLVGIFSQFILLPALTFVAILIIKPHPSFALGMMMMQPALVVIHLISTVKWPKEMLLYL